MPSIHNLEKLASGDVSYFLENETDEQALKAVRGSIEFMKDEEAYKGVYGFNKEFEDLPLPPEVYSNPIPVDGRQTSIIRMIRDHGPGRHLDIASSNGVLLAKARLEGLTTSGLGVELNSSWASLSRRVMIHLGISNVTIINEMFEHVRLEGSFDIITAGEVLEHVIDPVGIMRRAASLLSPNGVIITTVPVRCPTLGQEDLQRVLHEESRQHVRHLDRDKMLVIASAVGLREHNCVLEGSTWVNLISSWKRD